MKSECCECLKIIPPNEHYSSCEIDWTYCCSKECSDIHHQKHLDEGISFMTVKLSHNTYITDDEYVKNFRDSL